MMMYHLLRSIAMGQMGTRGLLRLMEEEVAVRMRNHWYIHSLGYFNFVADWVRIRRPKSGTVRRMEMDHPNLLLRPQLSSQNQCPWVGDYYRYHVDQADSQPKRRVQKPASDSELSEDDTPLSAKKPAARKSTNGRAKAKPKYSESEESESEDEKPLAKKKAAAKPRASTSSVKRVKKEESDSEDEKPLAKKANGAAKGKATAKEEKKPVVKREKKVKEWVLLQRSRTRLTDSERRKIRSAFRTWSSTQLTNQYKWWEQGENDGSAKWTTLHHNGILFPPPYIPLPKNVKMKYDGTPSLAYSG
jgi:hypothetical protein